MTLSISLSKKFLVALLAIPAVGFSQTTLADYKNEYPDYNELILNNSQSYNFSIVDKKLKVLQDNFFESIILSENGIQNNQETFSYSELVKLKSYDAYSLVSANGREKKIKVVQSNEKQAQQSSIFYNDVKERQLIFPNLEAGAKKVYNYSTEFVDPFLLHKFIFGSMYPIKNSTFEITADKNINIGYKVFNDPNNNIVFTKTERKGKSVYTWTMKDIKPVKFEGNAPGYLHIVPHVDVYVKDYAIGNESVEVLDDVSRLYKYYQGFVKNLNKTEDQALKAKTREIIAGKSTDEEKIKSIFYWVKDNIKYIAFENGYEGFIPREASLVYQRKFGDCKDMSSIITEMAEYAEIPNVMLCWIGTRRIPYTYDQLSTPAVDDHMIAAFKKGNEYIFLDATDKETRYGIPTAFIQGKEALVNEPNEQFKIVAVPVVAASQNEVRETTILNLEGTKIVGSGTLQYNGFSRSHILPQIGDATGKTRFEMIKSLTVKGSNKFSLNSFEEKNTGDRDLPYVIDYKFELDDYVIELDGDLYINLFLDKLYENHSLEKDRVSKYEVDYLSKTNTKYELNIPVGYKVQFVPEDFKLDNALMSVNFDFETSASKVTLNIIIEQKMLLMDNAHFTLWNETIKQIKSKYTETLILQKQR